MSAFEQLLQQKGLLKTKEIIPVVKTTATNNSAFKNLLLEKGLLKDTNITKPKTPVLSAKDQREVQAKNLLTDITNNQKSKDIMSGVLKGINKAVKTTSTQPAKFVLPAPYKDVGGYLSSEKDLLKEQEKNYSSKINNLSNLSNELNKLKSANKIQEYNSKVGIYNSQLKDLQSFETNYKNSINNYNLGIKEYNIKNLPPAEYNLKKPTGSEIPLTKNLENLYKFSKTSEKILTPLSQPVTNWLNKRLPLKGETAEQTLKRGAIENAKDWAKVLAIPITIPFRIGAQMGAYGTTAYQEYKTGKPSKPIEIPKILQPLYGTKELKGVGRDYVDNLNTGMPAWAAFTLSASKAVLNIASLGGMIENLMQLHNIETLQEGKLFPKENENIIENLGLKETAQQPVYILSPNNPDIYAKITPNSVDILRADEVGLIPDNLKLNISSYDISILKKQPSLYDKLNNFLNGNTSVIGERIDLGDIGIKPDINGLPALPSGEMIKTPTSITTAIPLSATIPPPQTPQTPVDISYQGTGQGSIRRTVVGNLKSYNLNNEIIDNSGGNITDKTKQVLKEIQGNPEATVTIYRAAPKSSGINNGDWITLDQTIAEKFTKSRLGKEIPNYEVQKLNVKAKEIIPQKSAGKNRIYDFSYQPQATQAPVSVSAAKLDASGLNKNAPDYKIQKAQQKIDTFIRNKDKYIQGLVKAGKQLGVPAKEGIIQATNIYEGRLYELKDWLKQGALTQDEIAARQKAHDESRIQSTKDVFVKRAEAFKNNPEGEVWGKSKQDASEKIAKLEAEASILKRKKSEISRRFDLTTSENKINELTTQSNKIESDIIKLEEKLNILKKENEPAFGFKIKNNDGEFIPIEQTSDTSYKAINTQTGKIEVVYIPNKNAGYLKAEDLNTKIIRDYNQNDKTIKDIISEYSKKEQLTDIWNEANKPQAESKYLYHGTSEYAFGKIQKEGIIPQRRGITSLSKSEDYSKNWAFPEATKTKGVMLRVKADAVKTMQSTSGVPTDKLNELLTKQIIPPKNIEVYKNGKWQPLTSLSMEKGQGDILASESKIEDITEPISFKETHTLIKRSAIIKNLSEKLNVPIKRGHFSKPKAAGIYKIKPDIIRVKQGGVGTVSHEVGHFLDDNFQDLHNLITKTYKNELAPLDYDVNKQRANEGFSEYLRYYITQPNIVESKAPNFHNAFTEWLNKNEDIKNIIESARDDYKKWQEMPSVMKVKSQISFEEDKGRINVKDIETKLRTWIPDDLAPLENYVKLAKKQGISMTDEENPYLLARLYRGWVGKANHFLENGTFDTKLNINGKGLKEILNPVKDNLDDLSTYLIAKRVPELQARKIKTGINAGDAKQAIIDLEKLYPVFKEVSDEIYKYQDRVMNYALEGGLTDAKTFVKIRVMNQNYVPFFRVMEELGNKGFFGKKFANLTSPTKRIKGSERDIVNPLESIVKNTYTIISATDRNITARMIADLANKDKELGRLVEKISTPMAKVASVNIAEEIQKITGIDAEDTRMMIDIFRPSFLNGKENILTVLNGGKKEYYQVEQSLYNTMLGLDQKELAVAMKLLSYPAQWLRAGATTLSPEFLARNPIRDQWSAFLYSKSGYLPGYDMAKGLFSLIKRDDLYWEWVRSGGMQSMLVSMDRDYMKQNLKELFGKGWKANVNPIQWLQVISEFGEQATRLGEFKRMRAKGASIQTSGFSSREVTLDFAKGGTVAKQMNRIIAFLNANILGLSKFGREGFYGESTKAEKAKFWGRALIGITVPSIILYTINRKNKKYWEVPQWQRDLFWLIPYNDGNNFVRIPKPFEVGILMGSGVERALKFMEDKDKNAFDEFSDNFLRDLSPTANLPTAIKPIIENATNYSFFQRRRLESEKMENLLPQYRYTTFTPETAKGLGKLIGYSPIKIENLISGWTGGAGKLALDLLDLITGNKKKLPYTAETTPLIRGFLVREPVGSDSESINKFYNNYSKSEQAYNTLKELVKQGENIDKGKKDFPEYKYKKRYDKVNTQLADLRKKVNLVLNSKTLTPERKLELVRKYGALMTDIASKANEMFNE